MMGVNKTALNRDCPLGQVLVFLLCFTLHLQGFFRRRIAPRTIEHLFRKGRRALAPRYFAPTPKTSSCLEDSDYSLCYLTVSAPPSILPNEPCLGTDILIASQSRPLTLQTHSCIAL
ncbi:hypothetical protein V2G26_014201 [Clonostachys chloroleuca]